MSQVAPWQAAAAVEDLKQKTVFLTQNTLKTAQKRAKMTFSV